MKMDKAFKTSDISLVAFLLTQEISLLDIVEETSLRFCFLLSDFDRCELLKKQFLNNASAPAIELFSKREMLISEMKNRVKHGGQHG